MILLYFTVERVLSCFTSHNLIDAAARYLCPDFNEFVEFENLGTFDSNYWKCKPETPKELQPKLLYYDLAHQTNPISFEWNTTDFSEIGPTASWPTKITVFTHGFVDSIERRDSTEWMDPAREKLVKLGHGVVLFDWSSGAETFYNYALAASNTRVAGRMLGFFLHNLKKEFAVSTNLTRSELALHLVGHSLGAHVCGQAGDYYKKLTNESIERIDGLDPAGPLFLGEQAFNDTPFQYDQNANEETPEDTTGYFDNFHFLVDWLKSIGEDSTTVNHRDQNQNFKAGILKTLVAQKNPAPESSRLDKNDAHFVMVIHTNAFGFGLYENIGDVDFWPNGGIQQEGCLTLFHVIDENMSKCSHRYAHKLWEESLGETNNKITSLKCKAGTNIYEINNVTCTQKSDMLFGSQAQPRNLESEYEVYYVDTSKITIKPSNLMEVIVRIIVFFTIGLIVSLIAFSIYKVQRNTGVQEHHCLTCRDRDPMQRQRLNQNVMENHSLPEI